MNKKININFIKLLYLLFSVINMLGFILGLSWDGYIALMPYALVILIVIWLMVTYRFKLYINRKVDVLEILFIKLAVIILIFTTISFVYCKYQIFQYIFLHSEGAQDIVNNIIASAIIFTCWVPYSSFNHTLKNYQKKYFTFKEEVFFNIIENLQNFKSKKTSAKECALNIKKILFMNSQFLPMLFEEHLSGAKDNEYITYVGKCCNAFLLILDQEMSRITFGKSKTTYDFIVNWIYFFNDDKIEDYIYRPNFTMKAINSYYLTWE